MNILLIDNNDSFTYNLEHLLVNVTGEVPQVVSYDRLLHHDFCSHDLIVISPGPGAPRDYPFYQTILEYPVPVLGICLGMQIINEHFGGSTERLEGCFHGRTDRIEFSGKSYEVALYHSLCADRIGDGLKVIASTRHGLPMALRHQSRPILGYQFHPESFLTSCGEFFIEYGLSYIATGYHRTLVVDRLGA